MNSGPYLFTLTLPAVNKQSSIFFFLRCVCVYDHPSVMLNEGKPAKLLLDVLLGLGKAIYLQET